MSWFLKLLEYLGLYTRRHDRYPAIAAQVWGYGFARSWRRVDHEAAALALYEAGCTTVYLDLMGDRWSAAGELEGDFWWDTDNWQMLKRKLVPALEEYARRRIFVILSLASGNMRARYSNSCSAVYGAAWFEQLMDLVLAAANEAGMPTDGIAFCPIGEPSRECAGQMNAWIQVFNRRWPRRCLYNFGDRPTGVQPIHARPTGADAWWLEYHPLQATDPGAPNGNTVVITDTGPMIRWLNVSGSGEGPACLTNTRQYAERVKAAGNGFIYYGFGFDRDNLDIPCFNVIGSVYRS